MINAGPLRHKITIQRQEQTIGAHGEVVGDWVIDGSAWASIETLSGGEAEQARKVYADASFRIVLRNNKAKPLTTLHRIIAGTAIYNIGFIDNTDQLDQVLRVLCKSDVAVVSPYRSATLQPQWNIQQLISHTLQPSWNIQQAVSGTLQPSWDIFGGASATLQPSWDIASAVTPVSGTLQPSWDIAGAGPVIPATAIQALWWTA